MGAGKYTRLPFLLMTTAMLATAGSQAISQTNDFAGDIMIGFVADLAGPYQTYGYPSLNGALVAAENVNRDGGIEIDGKKYRLNFKICQANSEQAQGVACARQFSRDDDIKVILGGVGKVGPAIAAVTDPAEVIYMSTGSALAAKINEFEYVFAPIPGIDLRVQGAIKGIKRVWPEVKRVAFLVSDEPTSVVLPNFVEQFKEAGFEITEVQTYSASGSSLDPTPQLTRLKEGKPDVIFTGWAISEVAPIVQVNKDVQAAPRVYIYAAAGACDVLKDAIGPQLVLSHDQIGADLTMPVTETAKKFADDYKAYVDGPSQYKNETNTSNISTSLFYADAVLLLAKAIEKAGGAEDTAKLREALLNTEIDGIQGRYSFTPGRFSAQAVTHCTMNITGPGIRDSVAGQ